MLSMDKKNTYKILIVDDDTFLLSMYGLKFQNNGFDVDTVTDAHQALTRIRAGAQPDIVLMDMVMPGMTGFDLLGVIKRDKLLPEALLVMLTNQGTAADIEKAGTLGAHGYIIKATSIPSEVVETVLTMIKEHHTHI